MLSHTLWWGVEAQFSRGLEEKEAACDRGALARGAGDWAMLCLLRGGPDTALT